MDYQWVAEDGCWENDWAINQSDVGQDKSAILEYGSRRPLKTAKAAIYEDQPKKPTQRKEGPGTPLTSHLKGRAVVVTKDKEFNEKTKSMPFEITFQTKVAESEFVYSVTNSGPQEVVIEVPGLSRTWDQLIKKTKNNTTKARQWREFEPKSFAWPTFPPLPPVSEGGTDLKLQDNRQALRGGCDAYPRLCPGGRSTGPGDERSRDRLLAERHQ